MATFPDLSNLSSEAGIGRIFSLPNGSYPAYWGWILFGIWFIISSTLYFREKDKVGKENLLSSMSIAALAVMSLAIVGSIGQWITLEMLTFTMVIGLVIIGIWFVTTR